MGREARVRKVRVCKFCDCRDEMTAAELRQHVLEHRNKS